MKVTATAAGAYYLGKMGYSTSRTDVGHAFAILEAMNTVEQAVLVRRIQAALGNEDYHDVPASLAQSYITWALDKGYLQQGGSRYGTVDRSISSLVEPDCEDETDVEYLANQIRIRRQRDDDSYDLGRNYRDRMS